MEDGAPEAEKSGIFALATALATELVAAEKVRREPEETNHTVVELFCSLAKYVTPEFKHPLRVAQSWFVKTMYKSALLTNILQRDPFVPSSDGGIRLHQLLILLRGPSQELSRMGNRMCHGV